MTDSGGSSEGQDDNKNTNSNDNAHEISYFKMILKKWLTWL